MSIVVDAYWSTLVKLRTYSLQYACGARMKPKPHWEPILSKQHKVYSPLDFLVIKQYKVLSFSLGFLMSWGNLFHLNVQWCPLLLRPFVIVRLTKTSCFISLGAISLHILVGLTSASVHIVHSTENAYDVADRWLEDEGLSPGYRQQVVEFIIQNTGGAPPPMSFNSNYVDPYTGGKQPIVRLLL